MLAWLQAVIGCCLIISTNQQACPELCQCQSDQRPLSVTCDRGSLQTILFLYEIPDDTVILTITAPPRLQNQLKVGPIFRRFRNSLTELVICRSQIPAIGDNTFFGLNLLTSLDLSHNLLVYLTAFNFNGLSALRRLNLAHNRIQSAPSATFNHLTQLQLLDLSANRLSWLAPQVFMYLTDLLQLRLDRNQLVTLDVHHLSDVPQLQLLSCSSCQLQQLPSQLFTLLPRLRALNLSGNRIQRVPALNTLYGLRDLDLAGNRLSSLDKDMLHGLQLNSLNLSGNRITSLHWSALFVNVNVTRVDLSHNPITKWHALSKRFRVVASPSLRWLSLEGVHLEEASLEDLQAMLQTASQLQNLNLASSSLTSLPELLFTSLTQLVSLNLSNNHITDISQIEYDSWPLLQQLDLSGNRIELLQDAVVERLLAIVEVRLWNNPWWCGRCQAEGLLRWINLRYNNSMKSCPADHTSSSPCLRCSWPDGLNGTDITTLTSSDLPECEVSTREPTTTSTLQDLTSAETLTAEETSTSGAPPAATTDHNPCINSSACEAKLVVAETADRRHHQLLITGFVGGGFLLLMLAILAVAIRSWIIGRQTAVYYTNEGKSLTPRSSDSQLYIISTAHGALTNSTSSGGCDNRAHM